MKIKVNQRNTKLYADLINYTNIHSIEINLENSFDIEYIIKIVENNKSTLKSFVAHGNILSVKLYPKRLNSLIKILRSVGCYYAFNLHAFYDDIEYSQLNPEGYSASDSGGGGGGVNCDIDDWKNSLNYWQQITLNSWLEPINGYQQPWGYDDVEIVICSKY